MYAAFGYNKYNLIQHYVNNGNGEGRSCKGATPGLYPNQASVNNLTTTAGATVTLYAHWDCENPSVTLPSATKSGKVLEGWYNGSTKVGEAGDTYTPTASITLRANWVDKFDPVMTGANTILNVDGQQANAFTFNHVDNPTPHITVTSIDPINNGDGKVIEYDAANNKIIAHNAGTATIYFTQTETSTIKPGTSATYTYTVTKLTTSFTGSAYNLKVDGTQTANYSYTNTSAAQPTANSNDDFYYTIDEVSFTNEALNNGTNLVTFNPANKQITACNAGTAKITLHQKETYKYTGAMTSFNVAVAKHNNTIKIKGVANYSNSIYVDSYDNGLTLTADNTDYANYPITNTQTAGQDIATYYQGSNVVYSSYKLGTATWTLSQPENYKYVAGSGSFTVTVAKAAEATNCYVLDKPDQKSIAKYGDADDTQSQTYSWSDPGSVLKFKMWKYSGANDIGNSVFVYDANGNEIDKKEYSIGSMNTSETEYTISLSENARSVKFQNGGGSWASAGSFNTYIKAVTVTRKTWLNASDVTINRTAGGNPIYPSDGTGVGTLTINYSLANGGDLKITNDNPDKFSLSKTTISDVDCKTGTENITVSYTSDEAGTHYAHLVIYNQTYRKEVTLTGVTVKHEQTGNWKSGITPMALGIEVTEAYSSTLSSTNGVTYTVTSGTAVEIQDGKLVAVAAGNATVLAHVDGDATYNDIESTIDITVTTKAVQYISWSQNLLHLEIGGANVTLTATAQSDSVCSTNGSRPIAYSIKDGGSSVVEIVNGNELKINGAGRAIVIASQAGGADADGHDYLATSTEKQVVVRDPSAPCEAFIYEQEQEYKFECGSLIADNKDSEISFGGREPGSYTFRYKGEKKNGAFSEYFDGTMSVEQYVGGEWRSVENLGKPTISSYKTTTHTLDRSATKMRVKVTDAKGYHYYTDCQVTLARYIEVKESGVVTSRLTYSAFIGASQDKTINIKYSNIVGGITLTLSDGAPFELSSDYIDGSCGDASNTNITLTYNPVRAQTNAEYTLTVSDGTTTTVVTLDASSTPQPCTFSEDGDWSDDNWNTVPNASREAVISSGVDVVISSEVQVYGLTIEDNATVTIAPTGGLTIGDGGITNATKENLILKAKLEDDGEGDRGQTAFLRISPEYTGAMPEVTMEMLRIGYSASYTQDNFNARGVMTWQYMGAPIDAEETLLKSIVGGWINSWDEATGTWVNNRSTARVRPFIGFANSQSKSASGANWRIVSRRL